MRVTDRDPLRVVPGRASAVKISQINYVVISRELGLSMNILVHTPYQLVVVMYHGADVGSGTGMKCEACLGTAVRGLGGVSEGN